MKQSEVIEALYKIDCDWEVIQEFDGSIWVKFFAEDDSLEDEEEEPCN